SRGSDDGGGEGEVVTLKLVDAPRLTISSVRRGPDRCSRRSRSRTPLATLPTSPDRVPSSTSTRTTAARRRSHASGGGAPAPGWRVPSRPPPTQASRADRPRGRQRPCVGSGPAYRGGPGPGPLPGGWVDGRRDGGLVRPPC